MYSNVDYVTDFTKFSEYDDYMFSLGYEATLEDYDIDFAIAKIKGARAAARKGKKFNPGVEIPKIPDSPLPQGPVSNPTKLNLKLETAPSPYDVPTRYQVRRQEKEYLDALEKNDILADVIQNTTQDGTYRGKRKVSPFEGAQQVKPTLDNVDNVKYTNDTKVTPEVAPESYSPLVQVRSTNDTSDTKVIPESVSKSDSNEPNYINDRSRSNSTPKYTKPSRASSRSKVISSPNPDKKEKLNKNINWKKIGIGSGVGLVALGLEQVGQGALTGTGLFKGLATTDKAKLRYANTLAAKGKLDKANKVLNSIKDKSILMN